MLPNYIILLLSLVFYRYQIVQSVTWNIDVELPIIFTRLLSVFSFFSFDFLSIECVQRESNQFTKVLWWALGPIVLSFLNLFALLARMAKTKLLPPAIASEKRSALKATHGTYWLVFSYLVVPPVSLKLFQSLDCVELSGGKTYLRIDTSINCGSQSYQSFQVVDGLFTAAYLSVPLIWAVLLWRKGNRVNPPMDLSDPKRESKAIQARKADTGLSHLRFLFFAYRPPFYLMEVIEMYRRILFVGVLPLISTSVSRRAAFGMFLSLGSAAGYRESEPFVRPSDNLLVHISQYAILLTYSACLAIATDISKNLDSTLFGVTLVAANTLIFSLAVALSARRFYLEEKIGRSQGRRVLTSEEKNIILKVLEGRAVMASANPSQNSSSSAELGTVVGETGSLAQYLLKADSIKLIKTIGAGAFGEVSRQLSIAIARNLNDVKTYTA